MPAAPGLRPTPGIEEKPAQPGLATRRPSRDSQRAGPARLCSAPTQPGLLAAGPSRHLEKADRAGTAGCQPKPGFRATAQAGTGWVQPSNLVYRPGEAEFAVCRPANVNSGQEKLYSSRRRYMSARGMPKLTPDPYMPAGTLICRPGHKICRPDEVERRPGDADVDPGQPYAGPGELRSARETEEDLQCSEAMLMSSPRADEEDPVRMYSYQCLDQPHGGRQISSWLTSICHGMA
jgi:hypothetical protein